MALFGIIAAISKLTVRRPEVTKYQVHQVRNKYTDWRMGKDARKRKTVMEFGAERMRINSLRKNDILPTELREIADQEVKALPAYSNYISVRHRCVITSRPRGVVFRWRLSRIFWRHLADYNKLAGVQRAMW